MLLRLPYILIIGSTSGKQDHRVRSKGSRVNCRILQVRQTDWKRVEGRQRAYSRSDLSTETVESSARPFQGIDDVESGNGLALGVLGVGDGVTNHLWVKKGYQAYVTRGALNDDIRSPRRS